MRDEAKVVADVVCDHFCDSVPLFDLDDTHTNPDLISAYLGLSRTNMDMSASCPTRLSS